MRMTLRSHYNSEGQARNTEHWKLPRGHFVDVRLPKGKVSLWLDSNFQISPS